MKFTKLKNGEYSFKGLDIYTNDLIEGLIVLEKYDTTIEMQWRVQFPNNKGEYETEEFFKTLKNAKRWLTIK